MKAFTAVAVGAVVIGGCLQAPAQEKTQPSAAETAAIEAIEKAGGSVRQIAQNDGRLEVDFHLTGASVTDDDLAPVKNLGNVVHLHLGNTSIGDAGLAHLQGLTTLIRLHLEKTKVTDDGLRNLKGLRNLEYLNLYGAAISDAGLVHLQELSNLKDLYVWQTRVTGAGVERLKKALPNLNINTGWKVEESEPQEQKESPTP